MPVYHCSSYSSHLPSSSRLERSRCVGIVSIFFNHLAGVIFSMQFQRVRFPTTWSISIPMSNVLLLPFLLLYSSLTAAQFTECSPPLQRLPPLHRPPRGHLLGSHNPLWGTTPAKSSETNIPNPFYEIPYTVPSRNGFCHFGVTIRRTPYWNQPVAVRYHRVETLGVQIRTHVIEVLDRCVARRQ